MIQRERFSMLAYRVPLAVDDSFKGINNSCIIKFCDQNTCSDFLIFQVICQVLLYITDLLDDLFPKIIFAGYGLSTIT